MSWIDPNGYATRETADRAGRRMTKQLLGDVTIRRDLHFTITPRYSEEHKIDRYYIDLQGAAKREYEKVPVKMILHIDNGTGFMPIVPEVWCLALPSMIDELALHMSDRYVWTIAKE